jgi:hypothetical protein
MTLFELAAEMSRRLTRIYLRDEQGARPVHGTAQGFQAEPHWCGLILNPTSTSTLAAAPVSVQAIRQAGQDSWHPSLLSSGSVIHRHSSMERRSSHAPVSGAASDQYEHVA